MLEDLIREYVRYDPETGVLTARETRLKWKSGQPIGCPDAKGYLIFQVDKKLFKAHRVAWFLHTGAWPTGEIDHMNGDPSDNRISNLRDVPHYVNAQNSKRRDRDLPPGVYRAKKGRLFSQIKIGRKTVRIGAFDSADEAHEAFVAAKRRAHVLPPGWSYDR